MKSDGIGKERRGEEENGGGCVKERMQERTEGKKEEECKGREKLGK